MPVRYMTVGRSSEHADLVTELASEWRNPQAAKPEPLIVLEPGRDNKPEHIYVIWDLWAELDRVERSEIIMDAAERSLSKEELLNITIAMGLTVDEAKRMGLKF